MSRQIGPRYYESGFPPLSRRSVLGRLLAAAGVAGCAIRTARCNAAAAVDDSTRLADLGMQLDAQQRAAEVAKIMGGNFLRLFEANVSPGSQ